MLLNTGNLEIRGEVPTLDVLERISAINEAEDRLQEVQADWTLDISNTRALLEQRANHGRQSILRGGRSHSERLFLEVVQQIPQRFEVDMIDYIEVPEEVDTVGAILKAIAVKSKRITHFDGSEFLDNNADDEHIIDLLTAGGDIFVTPEDESVAQGALIKMTGRMGLSIASGVLPEGPTSRREMLEVCQTILTPKMDATLTRSEVDPTVFKFVAKPKAANLGRSAVSGDAEM